MTDWVNELSNIKDDLNAGVSLEAIGRFYGVSKQRVYQVLTKFGIDTPARKRDNFLKDKEPKYYWFNKALCTSGFTGKARTKLLKTMLVPDTCPVLGIKINYDGCGVADSYIRVDDSPSISRIDRTKGFTANNIAVISWRANRIKNDGTYKEHELIANWTKESLQL